MADVRYTQLADTMGGPMVVAQRTVMRLMRGIVANCVTNCVQSCDVSSAQMIPLNASLCIIRLASCSDATFRPVLILIHRPVSAMFFRTESRISIVTRPGEYRNFCFCGAQGGLWVLIAPNWIFFADFYSFREISMRSINGLKMLFGVDLILHLRSFFLGGGRYLIERLNWNIGLKICYYSGVSFVFMSWMKFFSLIERFLQECLIFKECYY